MNKTVGIFASLRRREIDEEYHDNDGSAETVFSLDSSGGGKGGGETRTTSGMMTNAMALPIRIRWVARRFHC